MKVLIFIFKNPQFNTIIMIIVNKTHFHSFGLKIPQSLKYSKSIIILDFIRHTYFLIRFEIYTEKCNTLVPFCIIYKYYCLYSRHITIGDNSKKIEL